MDIYQNEIMPQVEQLSQKSFDDLMYAISEKFLDLRNTVIKKHFNNSTDADVRVEAIDLAACCIAIAERIDTEGNKDIAKKEGV